MHSAHEYTSTKPDRAMTSGNAHETAVVLMYQATFYLQVLKNSADGKSLAVCCSITIIYRSRCPQVNIIVTYRKYFRIAQR